MIQLTRLNGNALSVNCDLIKHVESAPDTVITLITGEKLLVLEPSCEVAQLVLAYRTLLLQTSWPDASALLTASIAQRAAMLVETLALASSHPDSGR